MHNYILKSIVFSLLALCSAGAFAQRGILSGKVSDNRNLPVVGATIQEVKTGKSLLTDLHGYFQINLPAGTGYEIKVTAIGHVTKKLNQISIQENRVTTLNITLSNASVELENVVITLPAKTESINSMIRYQKNTPAVAQVLSAEAIGRAPDKDVGDALKRVTGISIQEGKYVNIRGLGDRYNQAMLNGVMLSSTEPDRNTFAFDIFPSAIVENIIINKTFLPEYPGEWAGGLIQVNTKGIPRSDFLNIKLGTSMNTKTIGKNFYRRPGGKLDWLGFDDGSRALPDEFPTKSRFARLNDAQKNAWGKKIASGSWGYEKKSGAFATLGQSLQLNGGFTGKLAGKRVGGVLSLSYSRSRKNLDYKNKSYNIHGNKAEESFNYFNQKSSQDILLGAMGNFSLKLNEHHQFTFRSLFNAHTITHTTLRTGKDYEANSIEGEYVKAFEYGFKSNLFFNTQISGEHNFPSLKTKLKWYGSFGILDQYIPNQRRIQFNKAPGNENAPWLALISNTLSQKTGSIFYSNLSDYLYNAGAGLTHKFKIAGTHQVIKAGYNLQIKDRLYNARPFAISLPSSDPALKQSGLDQIFQPGNFGEDGFQFDEISGIYYRYIANSILHAGYVQLENSVGKFLEVAWGVRYENFDQLVGSKDVLDPRHTHRIAGDFLPAINITAKLNRKTNLRIAAAQTVIRPEFRELTGMAFYDFELGATVVGNPNLLRTKVSHLDLRVEYYPDAGELFTAGVFYKYFDNPIELAFNQSGAGSSSTFNYLDNEGSTAKTYGAEVEFRKQLNFIPSLKNFTLQGNFSYIFNRVSFATKSLNRPMQGQSPYLINAGLEYDSEKTGWSGTLLFNQAGRRILYVGNEAVPAIWEAPRPLLDLQVAKKLWNDRGTITLNVTDLLNRQANFYHDLDGDKLYTKTDALVIQRNYGTGVSLSLSYTLK